MSKRKIKRKSLIRVYAARAIAVIVILTMLILMFCGCLYIGEHLFKKDDTKQSQEADKDTEKDTKEDTENAPENEQEPAGTEDTQPSESPSLPPSTKYAGFSVVVDPGHGGNDGGTSGDGETVIEKNINLDVSMKLAEILKSQGVEVIMTRDKDDYVSLEERVYQTNQTSADFFVSLHCNYFEGDSSIDGFEAFYCVDSPSSIYAENVVKAAEAKGNIVIRGATENNYFVTRKAEMDAILIEMGFLSNPEECSKLVSEDYHTTLAEAIAEGIFATFDEKAAGGTTAESE